MLMNCSNCIKASFSPSGMQPSLMRWCSSWSIVCRTARSEDAFYCAALIKMILNDETLAVPTDRWTSVATHADTTVTAHCISDLREPDSCVPCTKELREFHTAVRVSESTEIIFIIIILAYKSETYWKFKHREGAFILNFKTLSTASYELIRLLRNTHRIISLFKLFKLHPTAKCYIQGN